MEAEKLITEAKNILNSRTFFIQEETKREKAGELFNKAATLYKIDKEYVLAAKFYLKAAETSPCESRNRCIQAAKCYKTIGNLQEAIKLYVVISEQYTEDGKFYAAGKLYQEIAEMYGINMIDEAVAFYQKAYDSFRVNDAVHSATQCLDKMANLLAIQKKYSKAMEIYKDLAECSEVTWNATTYLYKACVCVLALPKFKETLPEFLETCKEICPAFDRSRECRFIEDILEAVDVDETKFTDVVYNYDQISKLEGWISEVLLFVKKHIGEDEIDLK
jgi:alpha-soluble NSF attachment protein